MLELPRIHIPSGIPASTSPPPTLKAVITIIILPSLANKPDASVKGTEKLRDHLEERLHSQIKTQPDTPVWSELPELALSPSIMNPTVS